MTVIFKYRDCGDLHFDFARVRCEDCGHEYLLAFFVNAGIFVHPVIRKEGKINDAVIENMLFWHHSGFHVYVGDRIEPDDKTGPGNLAGYIIRACFSQERLVYIPAEKSDDGIAKVIYTSKNRKSRKIFNAEEYYTGKLKVRTNKKQLKFPENMGFKRALVWKEIHDSLDGEIVEVKSLLKDFKKNGYDGTIGVITPFRHLANRLKQELYRFQPLLNVGKDVNTANGFQGGERDVVILVLGITSKLKKGQSWYAFADENRYIYNVAVSRARACLIVVGDKNIVREKALQVNSTALLNLTKDVEKRPQQTLSQSPGEEMLYNALCKAGLDPQQQYPLVGRYLDMALVKEKIDIEVDGEAFHLNRFGERKQDDIYRDLQVGSVGWRVCRFWFREVRDHLDDCVKQVIDLAQESS